jgi:hypothetical protein
MNYRFHPDAQAEMLSSAAYYEAHAPGKGIEFLEDVDLTIKLILRIPETWQKVAHGMRKLHLSKFPFCIIYGINEDGIDIVSISHCKRRPNSWHERLKGFN